MTDPAEISIWADESCLGNQFQARANPGGAGGLVEHWTGTKWERRDYWVSEPDTTNNRMALRSAIEGLRLLKKRPCTVHFGSDSTYLVDGITKWIEAWKVNNWTRGRGRIIANVELWRELDRCASRHRVRWSWVRGHAGHPQNEYANHLATRAAKEGTASGGLVESGYSVWLEVQRDRYGRYLDHFEHAPPGPRARADTIEK